MLQNTPTPHMQDYDMDHVPDVEQLMSRLGSLESAAFTAGEQQAYIISTLQALSLAPPHRGSGLYRAPQFASDDHCQHQAASELHASYAGEGMLTGSSDDGAARQHSGPWITDTDERRRQKQVQNEAQKRYRCAADCIVPSSANARLDRLGSWQCFSGHKPSRTHCRAARACRAGGHL